MQIKSNTKIASWMNFIWLAVRHFCEVSAILVLLAMMALTCTDIVARYFFNSPIKGAFELTEIFLGVLVFLSLPIAAQNDSHIKVDLISSFGNGLINRFIKIFVFLASLSVFVLLTRQFYTHAIKLEKYGQVTNSLEIPLYFVGLLAAFCGALTVIIMIINEFRNNEIV